MPEEIKNPAAGEGTENKGADTGEDQKGADQNQKPNETDTGTEENAGKGEGTEGGEGVGQEDQKGQDKSAKAPKDEGSQKDDEFIDDNLEPPVKPRLSSQDYIIGRQHKKLSKKDESDDDKDKDNKDEGGDNDVMPEDEALINKVVAKNFAPIIDKSLADDDDREVASFLVENPDFKPFEAKVRRFMKHPSRRQLPVKSIFYEVAGDRMLKIGADRRAAADKEGNNSQTGGGSNRTDDTVVNDFDLTLEEFQAKQERIRRGQKA